MSQFTRQTILDSLPHRPPFLFVDEIRDWTEEKIVTAYRFKEDEFFFKGHYPERPIVPGVILCESAMQAGAIFLSRLFQSEKETGAVGFAERRRVRERSGIPVFSVDMVEALI